MDEDEATFRLLAFARHVGTPEADPKDTAIARGWLDADGAITPDCSACLESLDAQGETRTVFRGNF